MKALVTKASEFCFSEGKDLEKMGKAKSKRVTKTHFEQALKAIRPSVQGKEKVRYEKTRQELTPHYNLETSIGKSNYCFKIPPLDGTCLKVS